MDSSLSKALIMVASVLLAMIVIAFMSFSFRRVGTWSSNKEDEVLIEQKEKFNKEYEVYDKSLMYGVDVISCLNKVKSNNDDIQGKYAEAIDKNYAITVKFTLNTPLTESIRVYYMNSNTKKESEYQGNNQPNKGLKEMDKLFSVSDKIKSNLSKIDWNLNLKHISGIETKIKAKTYKLSCENGVDTSDSEVLALLECSNEVKQIIKNKDSSTSILENGWTKAVWETPVYNLKTRKFKCTNISYNTNTGRVNYIEFKEF